MKTGNLITRVAVLALITLFMGTATAAPRFAPDGRSGYPVAHEAPVDVTRATTADDDYYDDEVSGEKTCSMVAKYARKSCRDEVNGDHWLALGKCTNLSDPDDREECFEEAEEAYSEERELCRDQHEARLEICEELGESPYDPEIDPEMFVEVIDNPFLPYIPGTEWVYEGETEEGMERIVVEVTDDTREIMGVNCTVVRDRVYLEGDLIEDTFDWYAQDIYGNVWYFGEITWELEDGVIVSLEGSWESGEDGAMPGIVMHAAPVIGDFYRQEFLLGEAEDMGEVVSLDESVSVEYGDFDGCIQTRDWTPIEPDVTEYKYYAYGVGFIMEEKPEDGERVELVSFSML